MNSRKRWIDLSDQGIYLGSITMSDGLERLALLDMKDSIPPQQLAPLGWRQFQDTTALQQGLYWMDPGQGIRSSSLAAALGIAKCPIIEVDANEVEAVFAAKIEEKFKANVHSVTLRSEVLGVNAQGLTVYQSPADRFIKISPWRAITERQGEQLGLRSTVFLRARTPDDIAPCADGFVAQIVGGKRCTWRDLQKFATVIFDSKSPSDEQLHALQEALEASAYRSMAKPISKDNQRALFEEAQNLYFGLPTARIRTSESIYLQQYSTPLPMAVIAQSLVRGRDELTGQSVLEPTAGNGGLLSMTAQTAQVYAIELDPKRLQTLKQIPGVTAEMGDATEVDFREQFSVPEGFDYTIANPPFGGMASPRSFDKLVAVRRIDHFIALRTLAARKDEGRSVFILGADSAQSNGKVLGGAVHFLNYVHDHYEVHGLVEVDGRLYSRQGSAYNVRLLVVGPKRAEPITSAVPDRLAVITSYGQLWGWAERVIASYDTPAPQAQTQAQKTDQPSEPQVNRPASPDVVQEPALQAQVGERVRFTALDAGQPLSVGVIEGLVINADKTQIGNIRYRIQTEQLAPQGGGLLEKVVYSDKGTLEKLGPLVPSDRDERLRTVYAAASRDWKEGFEWVGRIGEEALIQDLKASLQEFVVAQLRKQTPQEVFLAASIHLLTDQYQQSVLQGARLSKLSQGSTAWTDEGVWRKGYDEAWGEHSYAYLKHINSKGATAEGWAENRRPAWLKMDQDIGIQLAAVTAAIGPAAPVFLGEPAQRQANSFQAPYQAASEVAPASAMIPINMAGATYGALNDFQAQHGSVDEFVARRLKYPLEKVGRYFSPEQIDAIGLAIQSLDSGRGIINADQTGMGKGRFVAAMMRFAKLNQKTPVFITIKPELFTDIFRDIEDIGSRDLFKELFIFNNDVHVMQYGTEDEILYRATSPAVRQLTMQQMGLPEGTDMVLATYSQFQRSHATNAKTHLLAQISQGNTMLFLDESHVAAGASNTSAAIANAVANSGGVIYSSATPLKGVANFAIYNKVFPASVDLLKLPDTLRQGGEALQEAISANMARDGVLIRREHDFSRLTFQTRLPQADRQERNIELANKLSEVLGGLAFLAGDVAKMVGEANRGFDREWNAIPAEERTGQRMRASSMNFGSRLYALNRQFLLGIKIEDALDAALEALRAGRKPVVAVENTGESLLRQVLARRAGVEALESQLEELEELGQAMSKEQKEIAQNLGLRIAQALRDVRLEAPPQYRELLEIMLDRVGEIKTTDRYGNTQTKKASSEEYKEAEKALRELIREFPDLPLMPLDVLHHSLSTQGFPVAEVSGRTASLTHAEDGWRAQFHAKADAVANVAGFQSGKYDAIIITRSGSTGISLHASNRFENSDIRQRDFIVLQKAANIAEFLQWLGRVNRKDQVIEPVITMLDSGLPAELRLTMMHNAKLRKLSANTTSNRENVNASGDDLDLLNEVGDAVAMKYLQENREIAEYLDINLPSDDEAEDVGRFTQEAPYINKLLGRLMMCPVPQQQEILDLLTVRFSETLEELEQRGINPFKIPVHEWGATLVEEEDLQSGSLGQCKSTFDEAVKITTVSYERNLVPIRSESLAEMIRAGLKAYEANAPLDEARSLETYKQLLRDRSEQVLRAQLPSEFRTSELGLNEILANDKLGAVQTNQDKHRFLLNNLAEFKPGAVFSYEDLFKGTIKGVVVQAHFPTSKEHLFTLSKYKMRVAFPGEESPREVSLSAAFTSGTSLYQSYPLLKDLESAANNLQAKERVRAVFEPFDIADGGKVKKRQHLLTGNLFRACELAASHKLGSPILYTDSQGNRHRAVLLKDGISPQSIKSLPLAMDAEDANLYIEALLAIPAQARSSGSVLAARLFDVCVQTMRPGEGLMIEVAFRDTMCITLPGTKTKAGRLITDGRVFNIGEKTPPDSLRLRLSGNRTVMRAQFSRSQLSEVLKRLQSAGHVGKFYIPDVDQEVLKALKEQKAKSVREAGQRSTHRETRDAGPDQSPEVAM